MPNGDNNGYGNLPLDWDHQAIHVITGIKRLDNKVTRLDSKLDELTIQITELKGELKTQRAVAAIWGSGAAAFMYFVLNFITKNVDKLGL